MAVALLGSPVASMAASVTFNYTTDNTLSVWGQCADVSCQFPTVAYAPGPNGSNWQVADTQTLDLAPGTYSFAFFAQNLGAGNSGNPAGFLAEILVGSNSLLSSALWDATACASGDPNSCNFSGWTAATEYGSNGGSTIWSANNGGPVAGISSAANWIWLDENFSSDMNPYVALRTTFSVVPEPGTLMLLGIGLAGLGLSRRRRAV